MAHTNTEGLSILYLNAMHSYTATQNALVVAAERNHDILLLTKPYYSPGTRTIKAQGWEAVCVDHSALLVRSNIKHTPIPMAHPDIVATQIRGTTIMCIYTSPNEDIRAPLDALLGLITSITSPVILCGDFNCKTALVPGYETNARGVAFENLLHHTGLEIQNNSDPTWQRWNITSLNDYFCCRGVGMNSYRVHTDKDSLSDHFLISATAELQPTLKEDIFTTDKEKLYKHIGNVTLAEPKLLTKEDIDGFAGNLITTLQLCIEKASRRVETRRSVLPWWSPKLEQLKQCLCRLARQLRHHHNSLKLQVLLHTRKVLRKAYRRLIAKARFEAFRNFCSQDKPWGKAFATLKKRGATTTPLLIKADGSKCKTAEESTQLLIQSKFPPSTGQHPTPSGTGAQCPAPEIEAEEVTKILYKMETNKAPGLDQLSIHSLRALQ